MDIVALIAILIAVFNGIIAIYFITINAKEQNLAAQIIRDLNNCVKQKSNTNIKLTQAIDRIADGKYQHPETGRFVTRAKFYDEIL